MSTIASLKIEKAVQAALYLGPAEVKRAFAHEVELSLPKGGLVRARLAIAYAYEPQAGDSVLAIGNEEGYWIIGVIHGKGPSVLNFPADAELRAGGSLRISADRDVDIRSPQVGISSQKLRMIASEVVHSFGTLRQRIQELLSVHAGQSHTVVDGRAHTQAKSTSIVSEQKVSINGKEVHLG